MKNRILSRQVERYFTPEELNPNLLEFLELVDYTYERLIIERIMVDRATESMLNNAEKLTMRLKRMNDSLDSFNYHISHDLKTGFMNTIGLSNMMAKYLELKDYEKVQEIVNKQINNSESALNLIDKFLEISRLDSEFTFGDKEDVLIEETLQKIISNIPGLSAKQVVISLDNCSSVVYNSSAFTSIFTNLLSNSSKYRHPDRELKISLHFTRKDEKIVVIYTDNGIGIDLDENKAKLFKPFMRYSNKHNVEGTGIGLFLVKKIIDSENGEIHLESAPGKGVKFTLIL